jgi:hypothetical protein
MIQLLGGEEGAFTKTAETVWSYETSDGTVPRFA